MIKLLVLWFLRLCWALQQDFTVVLVLLHLPHTQYFQKQAVNERRQRFVFVTSYMQNIHTAIVTINYKYYSVCMKDINPEVMNPTYVHPSSELWVCLLLNWLWSPSPVPGPPLVPVASSRDQNLDWLRQVAIISVSIHHLFNGFCNKVV